MFQVSLRWSECHLVAGSVWATAVVHSAPVRLNCRRSQVAAGTSLACSGGRPGTFEEISETNSSYVFWLVEIWRALAHQLTKKKEIWKNDRRSKLLRSWSQGEVMTIRRGWFLCREGTWVVDGGQAGRFVTVRCLFVCLSSCADTLLRPGRMIWGWRVLNLHRMWTPLRQIVFGNLSYTNELWLIDWLPAKLFNFLVHPRTNVWLEDTCRKPTIDSLWI